MTIAPTSQMMLFIGFPLVWVTESVHVLEAIHWTPAATVRISAWTFRAPARITSDSFVRFMCAAAAHAALR
jgi:hypothetical protein